MWRAALMGTTWVVVTSPEGVEHILKTKFDNYPKARACVGAWAPAPMTPRAAMTLKLLRPNVYDTGPQDQGEPDNAAG